MGFAKFVRNYKQIMCEKTKNDKKTNEETDKCETETQKEEPKSYYYDDAHGYEIYVPEDDDNEK